MNLHDILQNKGDAIHTIDPQATLDDVVAELVRCNVGSLVVCVPSSGSEAGRMLGIITERDILRAQAAHRARLEELLVGDTMSKDPLTAAPETRLEEAMRLMTHHRVRHLPVTTGDVLHGIVSIGDLVKAHHDQLELENHYMKSYIRGEGAEVATYPEGS
jgi:CBS domain-containing protein